jgi:hypothetical protein
MSVALRSFIVAPPICGGLCDGRHTGELRMPRLYQITDVTLQIARLKCNVASKDTAISDLDSSYTNLSVTVKQWAAQAQTRQARLSSFRNRRHLSLLHLLPSRLIWVP